MRGAMVMMVMIGGAAMVVRGAEKPADFTPHVAWERYEVIPGRNIFLKARPHHFTAGGSHTAPPPPPPPTRATTTTDHADSHSGPVQVLRGLWIVGKEPTAFFENSVTGEVTPVAAGAGFEGGKIGPVTLDAVEFTHGATTRRITIGFTLDGSPAPAPLIPATTATAANTGATPAATTTTGATTGSATPNSAAAPPAHSAEAALLEKMRERRLKELGK